MFWTHFKKVHAIIFLEISLNAQAIYETISSSAFSKPAGCRLNEPPPLEVWPSPFQAENTLFLFCYRQRKKQAEKTHKKELPNNN